MTTEPFVIPTLVLDPETEPGEPTGYQAICAACPEWLGPRRASSLGALTDFDRHVETAAHRDAKLVAFIAEAEADDETD